MRIRVSAGADSAVDRVLLADEGLVGGGLGSLLLLGGTALVCAGFYTSQFIIGRAAA